MLNNTKKFKILQQIRDQSDAGKKPRMQCPICSKYDQGECWHKDKGISQPQDQENTKFSMQLQTIGEMSVMVQALQGLPTNP
jgi:hypothetical protein